MDSARFDALARRLASRRILLVGLGGLLFPIRAADPVIAKRKKKCKHGLRPCKDATGKRVCLTATQCCTDADCPVVAFCCGSHDCIDAGFCCTDADCGGARCCPQPSGGSVCRAACSGAARQRRDSASPAMPPPQSGGATVSRRQTSRRWARPGQMLSYPQSKPRHRLNPGRRKPPAPRPHRGADDLFAQRLDCVAAAIVSTAEIDGTSSVANTDVACAAHTAHAAGLVHAILVRLTDRRARRVRVAVDGGRADHLAGEGRVARAHHRHAVETASG